MTSLSVQELESQEEELKHLCNNLRLWNATIVIEPSLGSGLEHEEPPELMGNCVILTPKRLNQLGFSTAQFTKGVLLNNTWRKEVETDVSNILKVQE